MTQVCRAPEQLRSLRKVLLNALAVVVHPAEVELRAFMTQVCRGPVQLRSRPKVLRHALAVVVLLAPREVRLRLGLQFLRNIQ
jgi:hypothetical protein